VASPALRLLAARGRLVRSSPRILARSLPLRDGRRTAWAIWPDADEPIQAVDVAAPATARFMRTTFGSEPMSRRPLVDAARALVDPLSWDLVRCGALLEPRAPGLAARALADVDDGRLRNAHLVLFSPSGSQVAKAVCFVFAPGATAPEAVVIAMADPRWSDRLRHETGLVEELRSRLAHEPGVAGALPLPPLARVEPPGDLAVVVRADPLAAHTGDVVAPDRDRAWRWLRAFHAATTIRETAWTAGDAEGAVRALREIRPDRSPGAERALHDAAGASVPVCAAHGDFWSGNVAHDERTLRVFDWEWGTLEGGPLLDLWTYELSDAQFESHRPPAELAVRLRAALARVETELAERGLDPRLAAAGLPATAAELVLRFRRATGRPGAAEPALRLLLDPIEQVLAERGA
jgi:hypothetical protein